MRSPDRPAATMDYPQAWEFVRATKPEDHNERCSWRTEGGAFLCDCDVLWDEYVKRGGPDPQPARGGAR